jgi:L-serine kinase (ADP)
VTSGARFALLPIEQLRIHEEIRDDSLAELVARIRHDGEVLEPILVSEEGSVILDGHHRFAALQRLGARRVPAWVVAYERPEIVVDRWRPGPPISKEEVVERGRKGRPFPPKTTRHRVGLKLPKRSTPLEELLDGAAP